MPEQAFQDIDGVELGDSWFDWINAKYLGFRLPDQRIGIFYVPDRNAGVRRQVYLRSTDEVEIKDPYVKTDLPPPPTTPAAVTVYCYLRNGTGSKIAGVLVGETSRNGKAPIFFERPLTICPSLGPERFQQLMIANPDLWLPVGSP
jgi:exo-1,4-beta-D-glucosaminidase